MRSHLHTEIHTPRYLLRRNAALRAIKLLPPGRFLEIGCGRGELMPWLLRLGFRGVGAEISEEARTAAEARIEPFRPALRVVADMSAVAGTRFDLLIALEVLEHLEYDRSAVLSWREMLKPSGRILLSVPAHMRSWTAADAVGGHYRRYERGQLFDLLENSGFGIDRFWSYGFPATAFTRRLRPFVYSRRARDVASLGKDGRTRLSSFDSVRVLRAGHWIAGFAEVAGRIAHCVQVPFLRTDLGDGYLVTAHRR